METLSSSLEPKVSHYSEIEFPMFHLKNLSKQKKLNRNLSKKKKGSKNRAKAKLQLAKFHIKCHF